MSNARDLKAAAKYHAISGALLPLTLTGYAVWVANLFMAQRKTRVSVTAQGPLSARWFQHELGTRRDEASSRIMTVLPGVSPLGLRLVTGPMVFAHRMSGHVPKAFRYPYEGDVRPVHEASARVAYFDEALERYLGDIDQLVILGAGFDTRAFRTGEPRIKSFEVDMPKTQALKREIVQRAGIDSSNVTFVAADFENEDWLARLIQAGFDPAKPALFIWEGVIMYLDREAVEATLRKIASTAKGSVLVFDYFTTEALKSRGIYWRYARATTHMAGEPLKFGIDSTPPSRDRVAELVQSCGLSLVHQQTLGRETERRRAWGGFATARVS